MGSTSTRPRATCGGWSVAGDNQAMCAQYTDREVSCTAAHEAVTQRGYSWQTLHVKIGSNWIPDAGMVKRQEYHRCFVTVLTCAMKAMQ